MGHRVAPRKFVKAYNKEIRQWGNLLQIKDRSYHKMYIKDPVTDTLCDCSITTYVDDIAKRHLGTTGEAKELTKKSKAQQRS
jgi:hypothetical protein